MKQRIRKSLEERLWSHIDKSGGPDACWPWTAFRTKLGYGKIRVGYSTEGNRGTAIANRAMWEITKGPIPEGYNICHKCDYPPCCNPAHLFLGTLSDNMQDASAKGRLSKPKGRKTHCPQGHPYDAENTYIRRGHQNCRACAREYQRRKAAERKHNQ